MAFFEGGDLGGGGTVTSNYYYSPFKSVTNCQIRQANVYLNELFNKKSSPSLNLNR